MIRVARHLFSFVIGAWGAITLAALSFVDPLNALRGIGVDLPYEWTITADERRALFLALAFMWMFVWYYRQRTQFEDRQAPEPNMPLYLACRWIARDSEWAAQLHSSRDSEWVSLVDAALMTKAHDQSLALFGVPRNRGGAAYRLPKEFIDAAQWKNHNLVSADDPPTHMWAASKAQVEPSTYYDVRVDSREVRRIWPRRSVWARLMRRSPIERIGDYGPIFQRQDVAYRKRHGYFDAPLQAILSESTR